MHGALQPPPVPMKQTPLWQSFELPHGPPKPLSDAGGCPQVSSARFAAGSTITMQAWPVGQPMSAKHELRQYPSGDVTPPTVSSSSVQVRLFGQSLSPLVPGRHGAAHTPYGSQIALWQSLSAVHASPSCAVPVLFTQLKHAVPLQFDAAPHTIGDEQSVWI